MLNVALTVLIALSDGSSCMNSNCHPNIAKAKIVHGPIKAKGCPICHEKGEGYEHLPANHPHLKKIEKSKLNESCAVCHEEEISGKYVHAATREKSCLSCHEAHSSNFKYLLKNGEPPEICLSCHEEMAHEIKSHEIPHGALSIKRTCMNCHVAHTSNHKHLLKSTQPDLCLDCHSKEITATDKRKIVNIAEVLRKNEFKHEPINQGQCSGCHKVHGSDYRALLKANYSNEFYLPFSENEYALCFECHKSSLVNQREVSTQTNFRNGSLNLHFIHSVAVKGRSCQTCHEVHAAKNSKLIRDWIPFNGIQIPLEFEKTSSGGSCATACHGTKYYDRLQEVKNDSRN